MPDPEIPEMYSGEPVQDPAKEAALRDGFKSLQQRKKLFSESREVRYDWSIKFSQIHGFCIEGVSPTLDV